jgi:hypothetical protein
MTKPLPKREQAKQAVQTWLETEARTSTPDDSARLSYQNKSWEAVNASCTAALATGSEWLKVLLDRYPPLPAPLFA